MPITYNYWLVALSVAVAVFVSYTAFRLAARVTDARRPMRRNSMVGGATAMGIGIWSMHFIGMLAMSMRASLHYSLWLTVVSLLVAIASSWAAIQIVATTPLSRGRLALGGWVMGGGIGAMHYLGMAAIDISPAIRYQPTLVAASLVVAIGAAWGGLWLAFQPGRGFARLPATRLAAAVLMGVAISGTHYIGMAAAQFAPGAHGSGGIALDSTWFALATALVAASTLGLTLVTDIYTAELAARARAHAMRLQQINAQLRHQTLHDRLTGLPNRDAFFEQINSALDEARAGGTGFAVLALDLDRFKLINDSLGHGAGDRLLCEVATRLRTAVRAGDMVARMGGDEFLVLAPGVSRAAEAGQLANHVIAVLGKPLKLDSLEVLVSSSVGISLYPANGDSADALLLHADEALYSAKRQGGRTFQCFTPQMSGFAAERLRLEGELHRALDLKQFELHYQPRVDVATGRVSSVEALIRWRHPTRGYVSPLTFIPIAEETGLILPIGAWVLDEACHQARRWQQAGMPLRVAVNLSAVQFRQPDLLQVIASALSTHQVPPQLLELEITETAVMTDAEESVAILELLSRMNVVVSVDDFGTGYSNMSYLRRFPIDRLKIDTSFVAEITADPQSTLIVQAIISLAHSLRMKVTAEGVETQAQLDALAALGCDQYQGFLFSRPATPAALEPKLRAHLLNRPGADLAATSARLARPSWARTATITRGA